MIVYSYQKCSTCQNAIRFLEKHKLIFKVKEITLEPPSISELQQMLNYQHGDMQKLFNTFGQLYKEMHLKERLKEMAKDDALKLLTQHGMLVKRPFLIGENVGLTGFKESEWSLALLD